MVVHQMLDLLKSGQPGVLRTSFQTEALPDVLPQVQLPTPIQVNSEFMLEALVAPPTLAIVGAGHIAVPLAQIAQLAGFQIVVTDDRPDFAHPDRFPADAIVLPQPLNQALPQVINKPHLYAALVTRSYHHDLEALHLLLQAPTHYIGMIGSEKRVRMVHQVLLQAGYSASTLQAIHAPIGLDIGALTPAEIAVSISAELIQVRRGGNGHSLSERLGWGT
jgi:xanthine dehydrogenase accessory factor